MEESSVVVDSRASVQTAFPLETKVFFLHEMAELAHPSIKGRETIVPNQSFTQITPKGLKIVADIGLTDLLAQATTSIT